MTDGSVTVWMRALRGGDQDAAHQIWLRYRKAMLRLAARLVTPKYGRMAGPEDAVQSAFDSLFRRAKSGEFEQFEKREDLSKLLTTITRRKAINIVHSERAIKRSGSILGAEHDSVRDSARMHLALWLAPDGHISPEAELVMAETLENLFAMLPDEAACRVAEGRLEGLTTSQIAKKVGCSRATVCRRLQVIKKLWLEYFRRDKM